MTGFNDVKYFREVFKKHYNVSPSQYFKEKKKDNKEGGEKRRMNIYLESFGIFF